MRVLICGGRHFEDAETVHRELVRLHWQRPIQVLVHGSVTGVGIAAEAWARRNGVSVVRYPPNWEYFGKRAEGIRNAFMLEDSRPDLVLSFPGGRHTADLVYRASAGGIRVISVSPDGERTDTGAPEAPDPLSSAQLHSIPSMQPPALSCASA
jgi:hypothetical protein